MVVLDFDECVGQLVSTEEDVGQLLVLLPDRSRARGQQLSFCKIRGSFMATKSYLAALPTSTMMSLCKSHRDTTTGRESQPTS